MIPIFFFCYVKCITLESFEMGKSKKSRKSAKVEKITEIKSLQDLDEDKLDQYTLKALQNLAKRQGLEKASPKG